MTNRDRFRAALCFGKPMDRLPVVEWASWWDLTLARWREEGLDPALTGDELQRRLGLDVLRQYWFPCLAEDCPKPASHGAPLMEDEADYRALKKRLYPEHRIDPMLLEMRALESGPAREDTVLWFSMDGAFWFPRTLFGIENHLYAFYDYPELYHEILEDLADFQIRQMEKIYAVCTPEFMTIAEDMSYNNGPMLSRDMFMTFLAPYYRRVVPYVRSRGTRVFVDTDGDVTLMVPWLKEMGVEGVLPLERQAGVDIQAIRREHPDFLLIGAFDKMVMKKGEAAMRGEFERILPVMRQGGYVPGVDHQTPPDVSLENYGVYVRLLREYAEKAASR